jgi:hypothetical protein
VDQATLVGVSCLESRRPLSTVKLKTIVFGLLTLAGAAIGQDYGHRRFDWRDGTVYQETETDAGGFRFYDDNRGNSGFGQSIGRFDFDYDNHGSGFGQQIDIGTTRTRMTNSRSSAIRELTSHVLPFVVRASKKVRSFYFCAPCCSAPGNPNE